MPRVKILPVEGQNHGEDFLTRLGRIKQPQTQSRFGIGEWYGRSFVDLSSQERREFARIQGLRKDAKPVQPCPFQSAPGQQVNCNKVGGVCSLRLYEKARLTDEVSLAPGVNGELRTVCPNRFEERDTIYRWVGETILKCASPIVLKEIGFLKAPSEGKQPEEAGDNVGRIDKVLVVPGLNPLSWCALEVQAVYFQGRGMKDEFEAILNQTDDKLPFPVHRRQSDYRSSGPKRLMPQLQVKVPSLRRWGKKMAVVVDRIFFNSMGKMRAVDHVSNCDVAWFVVRYDEAGGGPRLLPDHLHLTTLEDSVEGLTAGLAVSLEVFEKRILTKLERLLGPTKVSTDE